MTIEDRKEKLHELLSEFDRTHGERARRLETLAGDIAARLDEIASAFGDVEEDDTLTAAAHPFDTEDVAFAETGSYSDEEFDAWLRREYTEIDSDDPIRDVLDVVYDLAEELKAVVDDLYRELDD